jgi:hypothetical protein
MKNSSIQNKIYSQLLKEEMMLKVPSVKLITMAA